MLHLTRWLGLDGVGPSTPQSTHLHTNDIFGFPPINNLCKNNDDIEVVVEFEFMLVLILISSSLSNSLDPHSQSSRKTTPSTNGDDNWRKVDWNIYHFIEGDWLTYYPLWFNTSKCKFRCIVSFHCIRFVHIISYHFTLLATKARTIFLLAIPKQI